MGIFKRMAGLVRGFFSKIVGSVEDNNPELVLQELNDLVERTRKGARDSIIRIQTDAELIKLEEQESKKRLEDVRTQIENAKNSRDLEVMTELLMREEEYLHEYEGNRAHYEKSIQEAAKVREEYSIFESEMNAKLSEIKSIKSRSRIASLRENIASLNSRQLSGSDTQSKLNNAMNKARDVVNTRTARANAYEAINDSDTNIKIRRLNVQERYKRARIKAVNMLDEETKSLTD